MNSRKSPAQAKERLGLPWFLLAVAVLVAVPASAGVSVWTSSGPAGVSIAALAIDPSNPSTLYAGGASGGIFKSTNGGQSWVVLQAANANPPGHRSVTALLVGSSSSSYVYASGQFGVLRSLDGGQSWSEANSGAIGDPMNDALYVDSMALDSGSPPTLYAAAWGIVSRSADGGGSWQYVPGWGFSLGQLPYASLVVPDPSNTSTLYVISGSGVHKSTNGGASWSVINNGLPGVPAVSDLATDPHDSSTLYAAAAGGLFKTNDGGSNWRPLGAGTIGFSKLAIDPVQTSTIYATSARGVFRSSDAGESWSPFSSGLTSLKVLSLAIDPSGTQLHAGTAGAGVFDYQTSPKAVCAPDQNKFCLLGRFQVTLTAVDPATGVAAAGQAVPQGDRFGYFSVPAFSGDAALPEIVVKMADATSLPAPFGGSFWIFYDGLTRLRYTLTVTDMASGRVKIYEGEGVCGGADTSGFPGQASGLASPASATTLAAGDGPELLLRGGRFRISVEATDPRTGVTALGAAMPQGDLYGYFSLPDFTGDPSFPEVFIRLTAQPDGSIGVIHTGLTDLTYTLTVTETISDAVRSYKNDASDPSHLCGGADLLAFPASNKKYDLLGAVVCCGGFGLEAARVEILDGPNAGAFAITLTGGLAGLYVISGLSPGRVSVRASHDGYQPQAQTIEITGDTRLDFNLGRTESLAGAWAGTVSESSTDEMVCFPDPKPATASLFQTDGRVIFGLTVSGGCLSPLEFDGNLTGTQLEGTMMAGAGPCAFAGTATGTGSASRIGLSAVLSSDSCGRVWATINLRR